MAAAAFTATLILKGKNGRVQHIRATISDVNAAYWVFSDGQSNLQLSGETDWSLVDVIIITGGTDTTQSELFVNNVSTGLYIDHKSNLNSSQFRQFITNPVGFRAGSMLRLKQLT